MNNNKTPGRPVLSTILLLCMLFLTTTSRANNVDQDAVLAPVNALHDGLIKLMENDGKDSFEQRYSMMKPIIENNFNTELIARVVLSRYWRSLDESGQTDFVSLFNRLTISTYVNRFDTFNNETFKFIEIQKMKENR